MQRDRAIEILLKRSLVTIQADAAKLAAYMAIAELEKVKQHLDTKTDAELDELVGRVMEQMAEGQIPAAC